MGSSICLPCSGIPGFGARGAQPRPPAHHEDYALAARIISRMAASLVSSAGVRPLRSLIAVSHRPLSSITATTSGWTLNAAKCRGVCFLSLSALTVVMEGLPSRALTISTCPWRAARDKAVLPRKPLTLTSTPAPIRNCTASVWPAWQAHMRGVLAASSRWPRASAGRAFSASTSPAVAADAAAVVGCGVANFPREPSGRMAEIPSSIGAAGDIWACVSASALPCL
mmetsp:Transcript_12106/g.27693  ORF Transcript_12106/g.27693 Transcript_12106/m.27693 type:complete len:226 (+) Transcript_12106:151-828(+)